MTGPSFATKRRISTMGLLALASAACVDLDRPQVTVGTPIDAAVETGSAGFDATMPIDVEDPGDTADAGPACPPGFIAVPGNPAVGQFPARFCVAKYEMKVGTQIAATDAGSPGPVPESRADGTPWVSVTADAANKLCGRMGQNFALISNAQWQTIARNIESVRTNWSGRAVGAGMINQGHSDALPAVALPAGLDHDPCSGTGEPTCADPLSPSYRQKRTHVLSNGFVIWDLAGNVWEKVRETPAGPDTVWIRFNSPSLTQDLRAHFAPLGDYTSEHGMGNFYGGNGARSCRGGAFFFGVIGKAGSEGQKDTGIFATNLNCYSEAGDGFRCVYTPP